VDLAFTPSGPLSTPRKHCLVVLKNDHNILERQLLF
jgi:hypothetical protein